MFKNEKVQLNLTGWKTREDIFTEKDLQAINTTRKMYEFIILFMFIEQKNSVLYIALYYSVF